MGLFLHLLSLFLTDPVFHHSPALLVWIKMRKKHLDIPALVSQVVLQLLLAVLEFLSIRSLELFYYINTYVCVYKRFLEQTIENMSPTS